MTTNQLSTLLDSVRILPSELPMYCVPDVIAALSLPLADTYLAVDKLPAGSWAVQPFRDADGVQQNFPAITADGLTLLLLTFEPLRDLAFSLLSPVVSASVPSVRKPRTPSADVTTRWGVQPVRHTLRSKGLSVTDLVELLNGVPGRAPGRFTKSSVNAILYGRQLPNPEFVVRGMYVFQCDASALFTDGVLSGYVKRYGPIAAVTRATQPSTPSTPLPIQPPISVEDETAYEPLPPFPDWIGTDKPIPSPLPPYARASSSQVNTGPTQAEKDAREAEDKRLMEEAYLEAVGASSMQEAMDRLAQPSFEAGFQVITGPDPDDDGEN